MAAPAQDDMHVHVPHPDRTIGAQLVASILAFKAVTDGAAYTYAGGDVASSRTFYVASQVPGGMRTWGVLMMAIGMLVIWGAGRDSADHPKDFNRVLSAATAFYILWGGMIVGAWLKLQVVPAWGAPSTAAVFAALYYVCGRAVAPGATWADRVVGWVGRVAGDLYHRVSARIPRGQA